LKFDFLTSGLSNTFGNHIELYINLKTIKNSIRAETFC
jgi:hypothetical protein